MPPLLSLTLLSSCLYYFYTAREKSCRPAKFFRLFYGRGGPFFFAEGKAEAVFFNPYEDDGDDKQGEDRRRQEPPMTTTAMLALVSEPAVMDRAVGSMPTTMVSVVMKIGRRRTLPASIMALRGSRPRSIRVSV